MRLTGWSEWVWYLMLHSYLLINCYTKFLTAIMRNKVQKMKLLIVKNNVILYFCQISNLSHSVHQTNQDQACKRIIVVDQLFFRDQSCICQSILCEHSWLPQVLYHVESNMWPLWLSLIIFCFPRQG